MLDEALKVGASTTDGDAWVDERITKKDIAKPTSQRAYLDFVSKYLEAMKANPGNSGDDKEADSVDLSPKDLSSQWKTHGTLNTIRPINLRPSNLSAPRKHTKFLTTVTATSATTTTTNCPSMVSPQAQ